MNRRRAPSTAAASPAGTAHHGAPGTTNHAGGHGAARDPGRASGHGAAYDVVGRSVQELLRDLERGTVTSRHLVAAYLRRIAALDGTPGTDGGLNAIVSVNPHAPEQARELDRERRRGRIRGALHGVPIIVKDNYLSREMPTSAGSIALADYRGREDSAVVARLREAGAVILGMANMSEFALHGTYTRSSTRGTTRNAFDPALSASGSSGGSAVAVAASMAPAAFATDSCGSVIGPAAHAGCVGLRPSGGRISGHGIVPLSLRQDAAGPITRTVADAALLTQVVAGPDPRDERTEAFPDTPDLMSALGPGGLRGARVGYPHWTREAWDAMNPGGHPGVEEVLSATARALEDIGRAGADLVPLSITHAQVLDALPSGGWLDIRPGLDRFLATAPADPPADWARTAPPGHPLTFADVVADGRSSLDATTIELWRVQEEVPHAEYTAAVAAQEEGKRVLDVFFRVHGLDAVVVPASVALANANWAGTSFCDVSANTGAPTVTVPCGYSTAGLPIGLQFICPRGQDAALLSMAHDYTSRHPHRRVPEWLGPLPVR